MKIKQYRPNFFEGFKPEVGQFSTYQELLAIPFLAEKARRPDFIRFKIGNRRDLLSARYTGYEAVVGVFEGEIAEEIVRKLL